MKISIAMATYNGAQFLQEQLQSFVDQSRRPDELIVTDDCSSDQTEMVVRKFAETAPFNVKLFRNKENLGYCGNFNAALMKTKGDLVFLSDQDDVWFPEKIERIVEIAGHYPDALMIMNDALLTDGNLNSTGLTKLGQMRSAGLGSDQFVMGCCSAVRRRLLNYALPIHKEFRSHDAWLAWFADGFGAKVISEEVLQYYRRHESNESQYIANRTKKNGRLQVFLESLKAVRATDSIRSAENHLHQLTVFYDAVCAAGEALDGEEKTMCDKLEKEFSKRIRLGEKRLSLRKQNLLQRIRFGVRLYRSGFYNDFNGLKSLLRDMFS